MSTVEEMVNMITTQRAYEMNSKVISTANQMLGTSPRSYDHSLETRPWTGSHDQADTREHTDVKLAAYSPSRP